MDSVLILQLVLITKNTMNNIINFNFNKSIVRTILIDNEPYFSLRDICSILQINNQTYMKKNVLDKKGIYTIKPLTNGGEQNMDFINEKNLYKVIFKSRMEKAIEFQDWVFEDVLPTIRKTGSYNINNSSYLLEQTNTLKQKQNSKDVNTFNYEKGGVEQTIKYNTQNCYITTGKTPMQIKEIGKEKGLKSNQRTSAKEVLRNTEPEKACVMTLNDQLVNKGMDLPKAYEITKTVEDFFKKVIKAGITPPELND